MERHRPVAVVAAARLRERERGVVAPLAEADPEEVADRHLDARRRLAVPIHAQHELAVERRLAREERQGIALIRRQS